AGNARVRRVVEFLATQPAAAHPLPPLCVPERMSQRLTGPPSPCCSRNGSRVRRGVSPCPPRRGLAGLVVPAGGSRTSSSAPRSRGEITRLERDGASAGELAARLAQRLSSSTVAKVAQRTDQETDHQTWRTRALAAGVWRAILLIGSIAVWLARRRPFR